MQLKKGARQRASQLLLAACVGCIACSRAAIVYQGCWVNAKDEFRALPFRVTANDYMTPEYCRRLAVNRFATTFGLEWGRECWLDPEAGDLTAVTRFGASPNCTAACTGNSSVSCGGDYTDDIYTITDPLPATIPERRYTHLGCFRDNQLDRVMKLLWVSNSSMTIDLCAHIAYNEEWPLFGVEWSRECWGGLDVNTSQSLGNSTDCTMQCPGNSSQVCGGALALNMFEVTDKYWVKEDYVSPWGPPPPSPSPAPEALSPIKLLTAANCTGAAASSPACKALLASGAPAVLASKSIITAAVLLAAVLLQ